MSHEDEPQAKKPFWKKPKMVALNLHETEGKLGNPVESDTFAGPS